MSQELQSTEVVLTRYKYRTDQLNIVIYFVHIFRHKTTSNASDILNRTYQAQGALTVAHKNKNQITIKDYAVPISTIKIYIMYYWTNTGIVQNVLIIL